MRKTTLLPLTIALVAFFGITGSTFAEAANQGLGFTSSRNWAGYAMNSAPNYTSVSGTWTIPAVPVSSQTSGDATWVGIGGVSNQDLIQAGTDAIVADGSLTYEAWYEMIPDAQIFVPLPIAAGDSVSVTITEQTPGTWAITITNNTTGKVFQKSVAYNSSHASAEWIEEMPSVNNGDILPIDSFGSVTFTNATAVSNGLVLNLNTGNAQPITLIDRNSQTLASPSSFLSDTSFTVTRSDIAANYDSINAPQTILWTGRGGFRRSGHGDIHYIIQGNSGSPTQTTPQQQTSTVTTVASIDPRIQALYQQIAILQALIQQLQLAQIQKQATIQNAQPVQVTVPLRMFLQGDASNRELFFTF
ncbi:MAG: hypothetical protein JWO50_812 [Candidatus Kaiserbacteria bacterium]|nr:hypothetical protein [Candidatus Kaiserbacteria bacterium]